MQRGVELACRYGAMSPPQSHERRSADCDDRSKLRGGWCWDSPSQICYLLVFVSVLFSLCHSSPVCILCLQTYHTHLTTHPPTCASTCWLKGPSSENSAHKKQSHTGSCEATCSGDVRVVTAYFAQNVRQFTTTLHVLVVFMATEQASKVLRRAVTEVMMSSNEQLALTLSVTSCPRSSLQVMTTHSLQLWELFGL